MATEAHKVTAVIVTYESRKTIDSALDALSPAHACGFAQCVVVDNASKDGTANHVAERYPWVKLERSTVNLGFGRGCNLGFASVTTPYVLFLNPDASIDPASLEVLTDFMDSHPNAAIVGPATEAGNGEFQDAGLLLTPLGLIRASLGRGNDYPDRRPIIPGEAPFETSWICGAVMLIRSSTFRELDGFDPKFFLYYEETDLCLRAKQLGMDIWVTGQARAHHIVGASAQQTGEKLSAQKFGTVVQHYYRSRFYYLVKHFGWLRAIAAELISAGLDWLRWARRYWTGKAGRSEADKLRRPYFRMPARPVE